MPTKSNRKSLYTRKNRSSSLSKTIKQWRRCATKMSTIVGIKKILGGYTYNTKRRSKSNKKKH